MALPPREDGAAHHRHQARAPAARPAPSTCMTHAEPGRCSRTCGRSEPSSDAARAPQAARAMQPDDLYRSPQRAGRRTTRAFRVAERLLLTGHSHQAWPDVALDGSSRPGTTPPSWSTTSGSAPSRRPSGCGAAMRGCSGTRTARSRSAQNTHELVIAVSLRPAAASAARGWSPPTASITPSAASSTGSARRASTIVKVPAEPAATLAERLAAAVDERTAAVLVSSVLFAQRAHRAGPGRACGGLRRATAPSCWWTPTTTSTWCRSRSSGEGLGARVRHRRRLQVLPARGGELPSCGCPRARRLRPVITGWFSEFSALTDGRRGGVPYGAGPDALGRCDLRPDQPLSRRARCSTSSRREGLTPELLRTVSQHQVGRLPCAVRRARPRPRGRLARSRRAAGAAGRFPGAPRAARPEL